MVGMVVHVLPFQPAAETHHSMKCVMRMAVIMGAALQGRTSCTAATAATACTAQVLDDSTKAHIRDKVDAAAAIAAEAGHPVQVG